jgi:hypothetical protein
MTNPEREASLLCSKKRAQALLQLWGAKPHDVPGALSPAHPCGTVTDLRSIADPFARIERAQRQLLKKEQDR